MNRRIDDEDRRVGPARGRKRDRFQRRDPETFPDRAAGDAVLRVRIIAVALDPDQNPNPNHVLLDHAPRVIRDLDENHVLLVTRGRARERVPERNPGDAVTVRAPEVVAADHDQSPDHINPDPNDDLEIVPDHITILEIVTEKNAAGDPPRLSELRVQNREPSRPNGDRAVVPGRCQNRRIDEVARGRKLYRATLMKIPTR